MIMSESKADILGNEEKGHIMANRYEQTITITKELAEAIRHILEDEPANEDECFGSKEPAITVTARFEDGKEMDVKCCGVDYEESGYNTGWTEAVLFDENGCELGCTDVEDEFLGDWELEHGDDEYVIHVIVEK